jgi:xanthine/CO dehydrogenase XdhC/CoxF family maturation factor
MPKPRPGRDVRLDTSLELLLEHAPPGDGPRVLATVVSTAGSTYRKPGARMLILEDGSYLGLLSGGCLEADLKLHADTVQSRGIAQAIEYDMRGPDDILFGIGAGCEGAMRILLEPARSGSIAVHALAAAGLAAHAGTPTALIAVHEAPAGVALGTHTVTDELPIGLAAAAREVVAREASCSFDGELAGARLRALIQFIAPTPHVLICGGGPDAQPVVATARALGWRVTVIDHRAAYAVAARFPGARVLCAPPASLRETVDLGGCHAAVVMSHHLSSDAGYLRELARARAPDYVGLLGPRARRNRLAEELGPDAERLQSRLRGPVGLELGAVTPEGIALAIVGEIHAFIAARPGAPRGGT